MHIETIDETEVCVTCTVPGCRQSFWVCPKTGGGYPENWRQPGFPWKCPTCSQTSSLTGDTVWARMLAGETDTLSVPKELQPETGDLVRIEKVAPLYFPDCQYVVIWDHGEDVRAYKCSDMTEVQIYQNRRGRTIQRPFG